MKRALLWSAALLATLGLPGCPIYPDDTDGCFSNSDCGNGFTCDYYSGACVADDVPRQCTYPSDCGPNYTCGADHRCHVSYPVKDAGAVTHDAAVTYPDASRADTGVTRDATIDEDAGDATSDALPTVDAMADSNLDGPADAARADAADAQTD